MKLNQLVSRRFEELAEKAAAISASKTLEMVGRESGTHYCSISEEDFNDWADSVENLLRRVFGEDSEHFKKFSHDAANVGKSEYLFRSIVTLFDAAREDYEQGYLLNLQSTVTAEVLGSVLEQARAFSSAGHTIPACVLAGAALEAALKEICSRNGIADVELEKMNAALTKQRVYKKALKKQITEWAKQRDAAAHGGENGHATANADEMIQGVSRLIADFV